MYRRILPLALCVFAGTAFAEDIPTRKPGLWEVKMSFDGKGMPAQTMQQCADAETDVALRSPPGSGADMCPKPVMKRSGDTMTMDSTCTIEGKKSQTHMVITGSFESAYTMKVSIKSDSVPGGGEMSMTMDAKWLGACRPDQRPGDLIMPGGMKMNIKDMQRVQQQRSGGLPQR